MRHLFVDAAHCFIEQTLTPLLYSLKRCPIYSHLNVLFISGYFRINNHKWWHIILHYDFLFLVVIKLFKNGRYWYLTSISSYVSSLYCRKFLTLFKDSRKLSFMKNTQRGLMWIGSPWSLKIWFKLKAKLMLRTCVSSRCWKETSLVNRVHEFFHIHLLRVSSFYSAPSGYTNFL